VGVAMVDLPDGRKARVTFDTKEQLDATVADLAKPAGAANFREADLPPLPPGYKLVQPSQAAPAASSLPPLPPGYHLVNPGDSAAGAAAPPKAPTYGERVGQAGQAFDAAVGNRGKVDLTGPGLEAAGRTGIAALEDVAAMGSGLVGDVAGAATSILSQDPKRGEAVRKGLTYEPRTAAGQAGQRYLGELVSPLSAVLGAPAAALERSGHPIAAQATRAALDVAPLKIPRLARGAAEVARPAAEAIAKRGEEAASVRAAEQAPKHAAITSAKQLGIRLPPSQAGGPVSSLLETAGGKIQTEQHLSRVNAKIVNRKAAEDIGLSAKEPLTPQNIARQEQKAFDVYDKVKKQGRITLDDQYRADLEQARKRTSELGSDFPEDMDDQVNKIIDRHNVPSADARSLVTKVKVLREAARKNMGPTADAETFERGRVQRAIATAMEDAIERQVGDKGLVSEFRAARQQLAKLYNVKSAVSKAGNLDASKLARQLKRGAPLSGNLRAIAEAYEAFPKALRNVEKLGGHAPLSTVDYLIGGAASIANPAHAAAFATGALARPAARALIGSKAFQRAVIRAPKTPRPGAIARGARRIADRPALDLGGSSATTLSAMSR